MHFVTVTTSDDQWSPLQSKKMTDGCTAAIFPEPSPMESMLQATVEFASQTSRGPLAVDEVNEIKSFCL